ncbi:hypothetical protein DSCA_38230 [Desulfosarcina alkanivorans]|uniref:Uncharacterized protein n=1 Tax=Desulfosarcina alkanivorans TaxID=571177 RepID=A0A5K7YNB3_9BACT|nr:hypothetical protein DSCA_38230 [Desulfosarcina alkanivorans]
MDVGRHRTVQNYNGEGRPVSTHSLGIVDSPGPEGYLIFKRSRRQSGWAFLDPESGDNGQAPASAVVCNPFEKGGER